MIDFSSLDSLIDSTPKHDALALLAGLASRVGLLASRLDGQAGVEASVAVDHRSLSMEQVAVILGRSVKTAYRLAQSGEIPAVKRGSRWEVYGPTLDAHMAKRASRSR